MNEPDSSIDWKLVEQIFHEVVELDDMSRDRFWSSSSHSEEFREVVESLMDHDRAMPRLGHAQSKVVEGGSVSKVPGPIPIVEDVSSYGGHLLFSPGTTVDDVELLYPVAQTSTSEVWCGQKVETSQRVAVKFLRDSNTASIQVERFAREVDVLKRLKHPNIASVLGAGSTSSGNPYFVMQWIDGVPITEYCDQNQLTIQQRVRLVCSLCEAIDYANKFLIVHRDLKPDNILVQDSGEISVLDFGIAKIISSEDSNELIQLTQRHERLLTPAYAAPEQNRGDAITTATDVHGIGIILYQLLCGHHPFSDAAQPIESELYDRVCSGVPNAPSQLVMLDAVPLGSMGAASQRKNPQLLAGYRQSTPSQLKRVLRGKLDLICAATLEKDSSRRIARAADLRQELTNWATNRPLNLESSSRSVSHWLHRYPARFVVVASVAAALLTGLAVFLVAQSHYSQDQVEINRLSSELKSSKQLVAQSRQTNDALKFTLERVVGAGSLKLKSAKTLAQQGDYSGARKLVEEISVSPSTELDDRLLLADVWRHLGHSSKAIDLLSGIVACPPMMFGEMTQQQRDFASESLARLLLDAGWPRFAVDMRERRFLADDPQRHDSGNRDLLDIQLLVAMSEYEIASERLAEFDASDQAALLGRDQRMDQLLLKIEIAFGKGEKKNAKAQIKALPRPFFANVIRRVKLLRLQSALASSPAEKQTYLQQGLEELAQSDLPNHSIGVRLIAELAQLSEGDVPSDEQNPWIRKAWQRIEESGEYGLREAFEIVQLRCDYAESDEVVDAVLSDSNRLDTFRALLYSSPYQHLAHASKLLRLAADPERNLAVAEQRKEVVARAADQFLLAAKGVPKKSNTNLAFAKAALAECSPSMDADDLRLNESETKKLLSRELKNQKSPVRILLQLAINAMENKDLGRVVHWIHRYQNYSSSDLENQLNAIVYIAEDCCSKNSFAAAEFIANAFLKSNVGSDEELEYYVRAAKVIARLPDRSPTSTSLMNRVIDRLNKIEGDDWKAELPAIQLIAAFYGEEVGALKLAQRLQKEYPDSIPLRTAIWNITQAMEANGDERLKAWRSAL